MHKRRTKLTWKRLLKALFRRKLSAFTLIELLVVISIISLIASIIALRIGNQRQAAAIVTAKTAVISGGKSIESFKAASDLQNGVIGNIANPNPVMDSLTGSVGSLGSIFTGTESQTALSYQQRLPITPTPNYTYWYWVPESTNSSRKIVDATNYGYAFFSTLIENNCAGYFRFQNGQINTGYPAFVAPSYVIPVPGGLVYNAVNQEWRQTVAVSNGGNTPLPGPTSLALRGLTPDIVLLNSSNTCVNSFSTPYVDFAANGIAPQTTVTVLLRFKGPATAVITYQPEVLYGNTPR